MKKWIENNLVLSWAIVSIIFAFVIHWLFKTPAPNEFWVADWESGDLLTFASTVALGLLAVWQNRKFKEENDKMQNRMEELTSQANELSIVNKIIEHESEKLAMLRKRKQDYIDACNTEAAMDDISEMPNQQNSFRKVYVEIKMDARDRKIRNATIELLLELDTYPLKDVKSVIDKVSAYSDCSINMVKEIRSLSADMETRNKKVNAESEFVREMSEFIWKREDILSKVIYGNLSLKEIKALYYTDVNEGGTTNGENANGVVGHDSAEHR